MKQGRSRSKIGVVGSNCRVFVNVKMGENCRKVTGRCRGGCVELSVFEVGRSEQ